MREVSTVRAEVSAAMAEAQVSGVNDEGGLKVAGVRCPQRAWAGGVDGEGRGVGSNGGGVGGVTKVREVSAARAEVSTATQVSVTKVSSRLQVSGVDDEHGQEVSTATAEVSATRARCRRRGVIVPTGIGPRAAPRPPNQNAPAHGPIAPHHARAKRGHAVQAITRAAHLTRRFLICNVSHTGSLTINALALRYYCARFLQQKVSLSMLLFALTLTVDYA